MTYECHGRAVGMRGIILNDLDLFEAGGREQTLEFLLRRPEGGITHTAERIAGSTFLIDFAEVATPLDQAGTCSGRMRPEEHARSHTGQFMNQSPWLGKMVKEPDIEDDIERAECRDGECL